MRHLPPLALLLILLPGCAPSGATRGPYAEREVITLDSPHGDRIVVEMYREDGVTTGWIAAPPAEVWIHMPAVYAAIGLGPETLSLHDPGTFRIAVQHHRARRLAGDRLSTFLRCGQALGPPKADNGQTRVSLASWLEPKDDGTTIRSRLQGTARDVGTSTAASACSSTGVLERIIIEELAARTGAEGSR